MDVLLHIKHRKPNEEPVPVPYTEEGEIEVIPILLDNIVEISAVIINLPTDLTKKENKLEVKESIKKVFDTIYSDLKGLKVLIHFQNDPLKLHPIYDMKIKHEDLESLVDQREKIIKRKEEVVSSLNVDIQVANFSDLF